MRRSSLFEQDHRKSINAIQGYKQVEFRTEMILHGKKGHEPEALEHHPIIDLVQDMKGISWIAMDIF